MSHQVSLPATLADQPVPREQLRALTTHAPTNGLRFERCDFDDQDLGGLALQSAQFIDCSFIGTHFEKAALVNTRWSGCRAGGASFSLADLADAAFERCDLNNTGWQRCKLSGASFVEVKLTGANFSEARTLGMTMKDSLLVSADLRGISFRKQRLQGLNFSMADLAACDFTDATLTDCDLTDANLKNTPFTRADLRRARLGPVSIGDLQRHYRGSLLSIDQAVQIVTAFGVEVG